MRILRAWLPTVVWAAAISIVSTGSFSADSTSRFILPFLHWLLPSASTQTLQLLHFLIRKCAHLTEYFILGALLLRAIRGDRTGWRWKWALIAIAIAAGYSALDEFHQSFVPTRTASPYDSLLDTAGAILAQVLLWLYARRRTAREEKPA
jgi:VanZ family protein